MIFKKLSPEIIMADPLPPATLFEVAAISGISTATFITVSPLVSSALGTALACTQAGCAIGTSMVGGFTGGFSATGVTFGVGSVLYNRRHKKWLRDNAGKYIVNKGVLEKLPVLAFVGIPNLAPIKPLYMVAFVNLLYFSKGYLEKSRELKLH